MILDEIDASALQICIDKYQPTTILSDIFDTLLCRKTHPEMIKKIVAARLSDHFSCVSDIACYQARQQAEKQCYQQSLAKHGDEEIDYDAMTQLMYHQLKKDHGDAIYFDKKTFCEYHKRIELAVEQRHVIADPVIVTFLKQQKALGKRIILLSDFYLQRAWIKELLCQQQLDDLYDDMLISADIFMTKCSGKLYNHLINNNIIDPQKTIMIGDNRHSDIQMAERYQLKTFHIERVNQIQFYKTQQQSYSSPHFINEVKKALPQHGDHVFLHFSILLLNVVNKLFEQCLKNQAHTLYFLAREGKIIKLLFDKYQRHLHGETPPIKTHYLLVSRRSTLAASLKPLESETFETLFRQYYRLSIRQFAQSLGFDIAIINQYCLILELDIDEIQKHIPSSAAFKKLKQYPEFITYYEQIRTEQQQNFLTYFNTFENTSSTPIHLFDVGWKGTIQDNLANLFPNRPFFGYYVGLSAPGNSSDTNIKQGLLFDYRKKNKAFRVYRENTSLFEVILGASHGSVLRYVTPQEQTSMVNCDINALEQKLFSDYIGPVQQHITHHFDSLLNNIDLYCQKSNVLDQYGLKQHYKKVFTPSKKELNWYQHIQHFENFGVFQYTQVSKHWVSSLLAQKHLRFLLPFYKWYRWYVK